MQRYAYSAFRHLFPTTSSLHEVGICEAIILEPYFSYVYNACFVLSSTRLHLSVLLDEYLVNNDTVK